MEKQTLKNTSNLIVGTDDNDTLVGTQGNDTIIGNKGDDLKVGGWGDDRFIWNNGDGSDQMEGDQGYDITEVNGAVEAGDDFELRANEHRTEFERLNLGNFTLNVDNVERFEINGGGGDDTLNVKDLTGTDVQKVIFRGGDGNDTFDATEANVTTIAYGDAGDDLLKGSSVPEITDTLKGGAGNDTIIGNKGDDLKIGGEGDDRLIWNNGDGSDTMEGDAGYDVTEVNGAVEAGDDFELRANGDRTEFERLNLGNFTLDVDNVERFEINGGGGDDTLNVKDLTGTDVQQVVFNGGEGNDYFDASAANVPIIALGGNGNDTLIGGAGDDLFLGGNGNDLTDGGAGNDTADFSDIPFEITANLQAGTAQYVVNDMVVEDQLISIENLNGSALNDYFIGDDQANVFQGGEGIDTLEGYGGNDTIIGDKGDDLKIGGEGDDRFIWNNGDGSDIMEGDKGYDITEVNGALEAGDDFELRANGDRTEFERLNLGNFTLNVDNVERFEINGGGGDDTLNVKDLTGTDVQQVVFHGGEGDDLFDASQTSVDILAFGDAGNDSLTGGKGDDLLEGGDGDDLLTGGKGADTFVVGFDGIDTIADFNFAEGDIIQLSAQEWGISDYDSLSYNTDSHSLWVGEAEVTKFATPIAEFNAAEYVELI
ncbi:MAG: calcium-binding protein [Cyanobacteria bacterium P01_G01_bin.67]